MSVVLCCRAPFNSFVAVGLFFLEILVVSLQPFSLGIFMSDGRRNSSFMPHIVGRKVADLIIYIYGQYGHLLELIAVFLYLLSRHKTALHVQHPTRNLHTYTYVRAHVEHHFSRTAAVSSGSHDISPKFCFFFHRFYLFFGITSLGLNCIFHLF